MGQIKGAKEFAMFQKGKKLTRKQAMRAKCYECNGLEESRADCDVDTCPIFPFRLYPNLSPLKLPSTAQEQAKGVGMGGISGSER